MKKVKQPMLWLHMDERERQMNDDYEWCLHDPEVRKKYGGKIVVAYKRKIWGVGKDHMAAWTAAVRKRGCPPKGHAAVVVVPHYIPEGGRAMKKAKPQKFGPFLDEREQQINDDYEWCLNEAEIRRKYNGQVVVVYKRKIWGVGKDHVAAWTAAIRKRGCPPKGYAAIVVVP